MQDLLRPAAHASTDTPLPPPDNLVLGLDVGGTKLAAGVVTGDGRAHSFVSAPAERDAGPTSMIDRLIALARDAVATAGVPWERIPAVGIACGGPLDPITGVIHFEADAQVDQVSSLVLNTYFETNVFEAGMILGHLKADIQTKPLL